MSESRRPGLRRTLTAVVAVLAIGVGFLAAAPSASAAGPWFVSPSGNNAASCLTALNACASIQGAYNKPGFVSGDTINVAAGTYLGQTLFTTKNANVVGSGTVILDGQASASLPTVALNGAGVTVNLTNLTIRNGGNNPYGGGIGAAAGTINATNVTLTGNRGALGGGAAVFQGATLTMTNSTVSNNTSTATANLTGAGAGIYVYGKTAAAAAGRLTLVNTNVTGNIANGAALAFTGNGGGVFNAGTTVIRNSTFTGNQAAPTTSTNALFKLRSGQGGAVFNGANDSDDVPVMTIEDSTINGGTVSGGFNAATGGAVANVETSLSGTSVSGDLTMTGTTLRNNVAIVGGGLYNGGTVNVSGGSIEGNSALSGGGMYQSPIVLGTAAATAVVDGTSFTTNTATGLTLANFGNGGAIFNGEKLTVRNATFSGNKAIASTVSSVATGWGGAIWNGAFLANDAPELTITNTDILGGAVSGANAVIGGAVASTGNVFGFAGAVPAKLTATGLDLTANVAAAGGGIYAGGPTTLTGGALDQNVANNASFGYGGAIYSAANPATGPVPTVTLDSVDATNNDAAVAGGAFALLSGVVTQLRNDSTVTGNNAGVLGGGVFNAGDLTVKSSSVDDNDSGFQGGGIYNGSTVATDLPKLVLDDSSVDDNTAATAGGGLVTIKGATLTATGGHINGNSAVGGGGAVVSDGAPASFDGTDFVDNTASASGGGALLNSGTTTIANSNLVGNHAIRTSGNTGLGGAIYSGSNTASAVTSLTIEASTLAANEAYAASVLVTFSPGSGATNTTSINRSTITGNSSESNTGAIAQFHPLTITGSTITDNTAVGGSGALSMVVPGTVSVAGTIVSGNSGPDCSAAVSDGGYNLGDTGDASCGFSPANNDVAGDPGLGALLDNGGQTGTRKPGPSSPALDRIPAGTATLCGAGGLDQRGISRPQGAKCDIGAVEVVQVAPTVDGPDTAHFTVGSAAAPVTFTTIGTPTASLESDTLPAGVTFTDNGDGTGTLGGTPAVGTGGDYTITVTATNEAGSGDTTIELTIHEAPKLSGPSAATYEVGEVGGPDLFEQTAGHPAADLSTNSDLPDGVEFTPLPNGQGTIGGTPAPGTGGLWPITIRGSNGTPPDPTWPFLLTVNEGPALTGPDAASFTVGTLSSSGEFSASGHPAPTLSATGLPVGLTMASTGAGKAHITGSAANGTGGVYDVTVSATNGIGDDDAKQVEVTVNEAPEITGPATVRFVAGSAGMTVFSADGYPGAGLSLEGTLPAGVTFVDNGNGTATLSGTPALSAVGPYDLTVRASNGVDPDATLQVTLEVVPPVSIETTALPEASIGSAYGGQIVAIGGLPPYEFTLVDGSLPAGLSLAPDGSVTGTPTGPTGTTTFTVMVSDGATPEQTATKQISITVTKGVTTLSVDPVLINGSVAPLGLTVRIGVVSATLTGGSPGVPIAGQTVVFKAGPATVCTGVTGLNGRVTCTMNLVNTLLVILALRVTATYAGNATWQPASAYGNLAG